MKFTKEQRFELAIQAYQKNETYAKKPSVRIIARYYDLPRSILQSRIQGRQIKQQHSESMQKLKPEQKNELLKWIKQIKIWGWPPRVSQVIFMTSELFAQNHFQLSSHKMSKNWAQKFLTRRTEFISMFSHFMNKNRMIMHKKKKLVDWFDLYKRILKNYKIEQQNIYNMNEKDFVMSMQSKLKIIYLKEHKLLLTADENREWVFFIECVNIFNEMLKIWIIFKSKFKQKCWTEALQNDHIIISENDWINNDIEHAWLEICFESKTRGRQKGKYRLLIIDDHQSHLTSKIIEFVKNHKIIILCLSSHFIDLLQFLNVDVFEPLTQVYKLELEALIRFDMRYAVDKVDFIKMYQKVRVKIMTSVNIKFVWIKSDLLSLNLVIVLEKLSFRISA